MCGSLGLSDRPQSTLDVVLLPLPGFVWTEQILAWQTKRASEKGSSCNPGSLTKSVYQPPLMHPSGTDLILYTPDEAARSPAPLFSRLGGSLLDAVMVAGRRHGHVSSWQDNSLLRRPSVQTSPLSPGPISLRGLAGPFKKEEGRGETTFYPTPPLTTAVNLPRSCTQAEVG